jgi:beta-lactamase superfamily II metal-dependent hydrolase
LRRRLALCLLSAALAAPVALAGPAAAAGPSGELTVAFLDMGQGDAAVYVGPCGEVGLVDAGDGSLDEVLAYLDAAGGRELAWISPSHYHADHIGDIVAIAQSPGVTVGAVYDRGGGADADDTQTYADYHAWAQGTGVRQAVDIGDVFTLCEDEQQVTFSVVSAGTDGTAAGQVPVGTENDRSLCLHVEHSLFDVATCGDISGRDDDADSDVESAVARAIGNVEVVKVNHHGSATSSNPTYVDTLQAELAVIPVGENSYGHPVPEVVERWQRNGMGHVLLTGDGTVEVATDGSSFVEYTQSGTGRNLNLDEPPSEPPPPKPAAQARTIDDSCPPDRIAEDGFTDVPQDNPHESAIDCVAHWQVTSGTGGGTYSPLGSVNREQMAAFIARLIERSGGSLPEPLRDYFDDDNGRPHERNINRLAEAGIVSGKGSGFYDWGGIVTRGAMAAFLTRAYDQRARQDGRGVLADGPDYFDDDNGHTQERAINKAAAAGFAGGLGDRVYAPDNGVRRDQMASFLARDLDLIVENGMAAVPAAPTPPPEPEPEPEPERPPNPGNSKNCDDFGTWREAQDWFEYYYPHYGDVAGLDADDDRIACESLPGAP